MEKVLRRRKLFEGESLEVRGWRRRRWRLRVGG
jgi:hypothetical protein